MLIQVGVYLLSKKLSELRLRARLWRLGFSDEMLGEGEQDGL